MTSPPDTVVPRIASTQEFLKSTRAIVWNKLAHGLCVATAVTGVVLLVDKIPEDKKIPVAVGGSLALGAFVVSNGISKRSDLLEEYFEAQVKANVVGDGSNPPGNAAAPAPATV